MPSAGQKAGDLIGLQVSPGFVIYVRRADVVTTIVPTEITTSQTVGPGEYILNPSAPLDIRLTNVIGGWTFKDPNKVLATHNVTFRAQASDGSWTNSRGLMEAGVFIADAAGARFDIDNLAGDDTHLVTISEEAQLVTEPWTKTYAVIGWTSVTWAIQTSNGSPYYIDWGDGNRTTESSGNITTAPITHNWASAFTGDIRIFIPDGGTIVAFEISDLPTGNISNLPADLRRFTVTQANTLSGTVVLPVGIEYFDCFGSTTMALDLTTLNAPSLTNLRLAGSNTSSGNIGALATGAPSLDTYFNLGNNTATFTGGTIGPDVVVVTDGVGISSGEVDALLIAVSDSVTANPRAVAVNTTGNAARTSASDAAVTNIVTTHGGTVTP